jgi:folate-binding protein YgfZ
VLRPIGWAAFNTTRIEAGQSLFGIDFDETFLPAETGRLDSAVSFTKGCYPGQEIVARMHARKQLAKQIAGIRMDGEALPVAGTLIYDEASNQIGAITSSTLSPILSNAAICLGILKRPFFNVGSVLQIPAEGAMRKATVVELPFKR